MAEGTVDPGAAAADLDFTALKAGHKIGRYTIAAVLGQGGFGITYRARDEQLHREVAIKEYLPSALAVRQDGVTVLPRSTKVAEDFGWGRQRFVDEGRTLATLQRAPAIVNVFDFLEANGTAYIVMEMLEGETLEHRLQRGPLTPSELDRILWPLLDGLEQVHATGFLHRDIKPANILLDGRGRPTLIDFGASRAAIAGRTSAMTAIFTPGYAAAEQMTAAKQGPWTDIYGLSATLYHAITGAAPPSAFDRMLDDHYVPLAERTFAGIPPGLLAGFDAGLAVRASDRPQSIAAWRPLLAGMSAPVAMAPVAVTPAAVVPVSVPPAPKRGKGLWLGVAAALVLALAGGGAWVATRPAPVEVAASLPVEPPPPAAPSAAPSAEDQQRQQELERLRAEKAERDQQAHDAQLRQQALEEERQKLQAEQAEKDKADRDAKAQAARAELEKRKALEADKAHAAEAEAALHLAPLDRQHIQVALTALGFDTNGTDGVFGQHTHDMIANWQKGRSYPVTGYVSAAQVQELLQTASAAVGRFDDDQKKAAAAPAPALPPVPQPVPQAAAPAPAPLAVTPHWTGMFKCDVWDGGMRLDFPVVNGEGSEKRSNVRGNQVVAVQVSGGQFSGRFDWTPSNSGPTSTSFSGAISGATIHKDIYVQTSGRRGSSGAAECHLDLQNVANP